MAEAGPPTTPAPESARYAHVRRAMEPAWNELREQRVLGRIQEAKRAKLEERRRSRVLVFAAAAIAAASIVSVIAYRTRTETSVATAPAPTASAPAKMVLVDGSEVVLSPDAQVKIEEQGEELIRVAQTAGEARYDVTPNPKRRFVVRVGDVTVRVLGTAFTVDLAHEKVKVHVVRGRVEIDDGRKTTELALGETLEVAAHRPAEPPVPSASAGPDKKAPATAGVTVEALLAKADEARAAHKYEEAANALRTLVAMHPGDGRVASALFTLGRVERARGRHAPAAEAFARCHKAAPHGALAEDALAEEAISWKSAGDKARAKTAASRYLQLHPSGPHAPRMMPLVE